MKRTLLVVTVAAAAGALLVATAFGGQSATPTLIGTVGPGFTINLKQAGKAVKTLKAGTYKFVIHDKASIHSFAMDGPNGFAKDFTKVPFVGTKTVTVKLKAGKYKFYCPPHEPTMFGRFTVK
jgi:plastocyanin